MVVLVIAGIWKVFTKAGKPGWYAIIPILNIVTLLRIAGKSAWWLLLLRIPFVNVVFLVLIYVAVGKAIGKTGGFVVGMIFLPIIFFPILGFGSSRYQLSGYGGQSAHQQYAAAL